MWIKICGVRDVRTARDVAALGPDAIGLNFFSASPRRVDAAAAAEIVKALPEEVAPVGVFVNAEAEEIRQTAQQAGLSIIQLHGDEPPELLHALGDFRLIRAFRMDDAGIKPIAQELDRLRELDVNLFACLIDAYVPGRYGGTGKTVAWDRICEEWNREHPPLVLAGGLTPDNVGAAIATCSPFGVDVAGGVESEPGVKDLALVEKFIENARRAS